MRWGPCAVNFGNPLAGNLQYGSSSCLHASQREAQSKENSGMRFEVIGHWRWLTSRMTMRSVSFWGRITVARRWWRLRLQEWLIGNRLDRRRSQKLMLSLLRAIDDGNREVVECVLHPRVLGQSSFILVLLGLF